MKKIIILSLCLLLSENSARSMHEENASAHKVAIVLRVKKGAKTTPKTQKEVNDGVVERGNQSADKRSQRVCFCIRLLL